MTILAFLLALIAVAFLWLSGRLRAQSGLPAGRVIYSDTGMWQRNPLSLFSKAHGLTGKPDYLIEQGTSQHPDMIIPVELKSATAPAQPHAGHVLQLAAYCLLVETHYGIRPTHGIVQYADKQFAIDYTPALERELLKVIAAMRADLDSGKAERSHDEAWRCAACGLKENCEKQIKNSKGKIQK